MRNRKKKKKTLEITVISALVSLQDVDVLSVT